MSETGKVEESPTEWLQGEGWLRTPPHGVRLGGAGVGTVADGHAANPGGLYDRLYAGAAAAGPRAEVLDGARLRARRRVVAELGPALQADDVAQGELSRRVQAVVDAALRDEKVVLSGPESAQVARSVLDDVLGFGPIDRFLRDPTVSEIMVNGPSRVYVERHGRIVPTRVSFDDEAHLRHVAARLVGEAGRHVDESSPMVDARLSDGSRVNAIYPPLAVGGPFVTVRKFAPEAYTVADLVAMGTLTPQVAAFLEACVAGRANIVIAGGASTGKTTLLNVLSSFVDQDERIITIEDAKELQLRQPHVVALEARPVNSEGKGEVTIRDLLRNALRMRPDRIIIGECRSGETLDMLAAMNTGHDGSLTTVHANGPRDTLSRLETMTLMAGYDLPVKAVREQMASALDLVVHLARTRSGERYVAAVAEVGGMEGEVVVLQDVYTRTSPAPAPGGVPGGLRPTGTRPRLAERLAHRGVVVEPWLFEPSAQGEHPPAHGEVPAAGLWAAGANARWWP